MSGSTEPSYTCHRMRLPDGARTTVHVVRLPRATTELRVEVFAHAEPLADWCQRTGARYALTGGFFSRRSGRPLGRLWLHGVAVASNPWGKHWAERRGALHVDAGRVTIAPLGELPTKPSGDLLTAGPMLVRDGRSLITPGYHFEGIPETWEGELDAEWTQIRAQRSALGVNDRELLAVACDGPPLDDRPDLDEAGMTIEELAVTMVTLGARDALNLDGGGGTSLVYDQRLVNRPRAGPHDPGHEYSAVMPHGRPIYTALSFSPATRRTPGA